MRSPRISLQWTGSRGRGPLERARRRRRKRPFCSSGLTECFLTSRLAPRLARILDSARAVVPCARQGQIFARRRLQTKRAEKTCRKHGCRLARSALPVGTQGSATRGARRATLKPQARLSGTLGGSEGNPVGDGSARARARAPSALREWDGLPAAKTVNKNAGGLLPPYTVGPRVRGPDRKLGVLVAA